MNNFNLKFNLFLVAGQFVASRITSVPPLVKTLHRVIRFRTGWYSDDHAEMERIFQAMRDPWNFQSSRYERERLQILRDEVLRLPHGSVCEIGCAEGMFTEQLSAVCDRVTAIDVSQTAIERARRRCSRPEYIPVSLEQYQPPGRFDLVVCAETLYYIRDVPAAIQKLSSIGRCCLVSYLEREAPRLDPHFTTLSRVIRKQFEFRIGVLKKKMICVTWENVETHIDTGTVLVGRSDDQQI